MQTFTLIKPVLPLRPILPPLSLERKSSPSCTSPHLSRRSTFVCVARVSATPKFTTLRCSSYKPALRPSLPSSKGISRRYTTSSGISPFTTKISGPRITSLTPRAAKKEPLIPPYPEMTEKPKWWWRSLACLPYMMALHQMMIYGGSQYHIHPFFENYEHLAYSFFYAVNRLPEWAWMIYLTAAFLGIVRRKEFPHFFRFHLLTGMLLEICQQVMFISTGWFPLGQYYGWMTKPLFRALGFGFLFTVIESIKCALAGFYPDIPFVSDAAYIQSTL